MGIFKPQTLNKNSNYLTKKLYLLIRNYHNLGKSLDFETLDSETLIVKNCNIEQIWQQLFFNANIFLKKINKLKFTEKLKMIIKIDVKEINKKKNNLSFKKKVRCFTKTN